MSVIDRQGFYFFSNCYNKPLLCNVLSHKSSIY
uniref:Uncharacterized protein n=1 Tax=Siphoviridae sp. ctA4S13 TaxID=2826179 RepID=A0A8S5MR35_9CAUD|nr:MAG TPA: hypothetical protein [Siphoviridae sp. ctA4S13]DAG37749.1 MAG TPA: hypothetical protein [Caudoviricetes sp.]